jgi:hypothetical protein
VRAAPRLLPQGTSTTNPRPTSAVCWRGILEGDPTVLRTCSIRACWRFHSFHRDETPATRTAYIAYVVSHSPPLP